MHPPNPRLIDLRELRGDDLAPVLEAQAEHWQTHFAWDLSLAVGLVRRMLDRRMLSGHGLLVADRPRGYCYFVPEGRKVIVGDLFVRGPDKGGRLERRLLESTLNAACLRSGAERIEGQLLCLKRLPPLRPALGGTLHSYPRMLMFKNGLSLAPAQRSNGPALQFCPWSDGLLDDASELIALAHRGHVDSRINDLYASVAGARRLVAQTTHLAVSARFCAPASIGAREPRTSGLRGISLGSFVGEEVGHVNQLCVDPRARRRGLGSELLGRSLGALARAGCRSASLTVTKSNEGAIRLYERFGFRPMASFPAFVWKRT